MEVNFITVMNSVDGKKMIINIQEIKKVSTDDNGTYICLKGDDELSVKETINEIRQKLGMNVYQ